MNDKVQYEDKKILNITFVHKHVECTDFVAL